MKLVMILATLTLGVSANAKTVPISKAPAPHVAVSNLRCAQAQAYASKYGYYYKFNGNDLVPIYPIETVPGDLRCPSKNGPRPQFEQTLDENVCVVSWYCGALGG